MPPISKRGAVLAWVLAMGMGVYYFQLFLPKVHEARASRDLLGGYTYGCDFYQVWLTSRELIFHRANPYTAEMTAKIQLGLFARRIDPSRPEDPRPNLALYSYPIYTDFVAAPFAFLSFRQVQIVGGLLFPLLVVASVLLWFQNLNLRASPTTLLAFLALTISSYPILEGIYALQLTFVVAALIAGAVTALMRGKMTFGGILLGVASIKPQLILLPGLFLVIWALSDFRKRKFAFLSFTGTIVVLILLGEAIIPGWFRAWIQALGEYRHYDAPPLTQLVLGRLPGGLLSLGLALVAIVLIIRARRTPADSIEFSCTMALLLAITVPVLPSSIAVYDQVLLVPLLLWLLARKEQIFRGSSALRGAAYATGAALGWQWIAATGLFLFSLASASAVVLPWLVLPLRAAASVPFALVLLGLWTAAKSH